MVKWKIPAWVGAAGAVISLAAGIAGGNPFGTVLLRALASALLAGALGFAAQHLLRRFLPELGAAAPEAPPPGVDILVDEELPIIAGEQGSAGSGRQDSRPSEHAGFGPDFTPSRSSGFTADSAAQQGLSEEAALDLGEGAEEPAEAEAFPDLEEAGDFQPSPDRAGPKPDAGLAALPELESGEGALEPPEQFSTGQAREALPADGLPDFGDVEQGVPSRRSLKAGELEAQLDDVMQGQDAASLAKAVRTFLRKDQEG